MSQILHASELTAGRLKQIVNRFHDDVLIVFENGGVEYSIDHVKVNRDHIRYHEEKQWADNLTLHIKPRRIINHQVQE